MKNRIRLSLVFVAILLYLGLLVFFPWNRLTRPHSWKSALPPDARVAGGQGFGRTIYWGLIEHRGREAATVQSYRTIALVLGKDLGIRIDVRRVAGYRELERQFLSGALDLASFSSFAYVALHDRHERRIRPLVTETYQGSRYYVGYFFTRADAPLRTLSDLRGVTFAFVSPRSASGYVFPRAHLRALGYDPDSFFGKVVFSGSHAATVGLVRDGRVQAGVTFDASFRGAQQGELRVIAKTAKVPGGVLCAGGGLPEPIVSGLEYRLRVLSRESSPMMQDFRRRTGITGWASVLEADYAVVRRALAAGRKQ